RGAPPGRPLRGDEPAAGAGVHARRERSAGRGARPRAAERGRAHLTSERRIRRPRSGGICLNIDMNKLMKQAQQMQAQMQKVQEEVANEIVEASAGGGMVTVKATGAGEIREIKIDPKAIDPDDPEFLEDAVLAAVSEALRSAQSLMQSKLGTRGLGTLGLPGL